MGGDITALLGRLNDGDDAAGEEIAEMLYPEVKRIAGAVFRREGRPDHTLTPTAIANEAYVRLQGGSMGATDRVHYLALAARVIRQVLVDHAREHGAQKRGGDLARVDLSGAELLDVPAQQNDPFDIVPLDTALKSLKTTNPDAARVVVLKFFGGMTIPEIAAEMKISEAGVSRKWTLARSWLRAELE